MTPERTRSETELAIAGGLRHVALFPQLDEHTLQTIAARSALQVPVTATKFFPSVIRVMMCSSYSTEAFR
jgi:hypothetical protein